MPTSPMNSVIDHLRRAVLRDSAGLGDRELLGCFIGRHDEAAFAALVQRHGPMVWGVCRRLLSHHDAEDAFQAAFLILVRKAASIVPREMVGNWLYGVAHQTALQARRTAARRRAREVQVTVMPDTEAVQHDQWPDVQPLLDQELSRLPDNYRAVLVLCDLEGRTRKEVARQLGVPEGTVAGRLARARALLARRLTERGIALSGGVLAAVLVQNVASAGVPDSVAASTISVGSYFAAGQVAAAVPVSGKVAALTEGVLKAMMMSKLKVVVAVVLVLGFIVTGATGLYWRTATAQGKQPPAVEERVKVPQKQKETEGFTAWGKEAGGLQAGLGYLPGQHRTYHTGETVTLVVRVRNVSKEAVKVQYLPQFFGYKGPAVTDSAGKPVDYGYGVDDTAEVHLPVNVSLAPGEEMVLGEVKLPTADVGTGKFTVQYERVFGKTPQGRLEVDPTLMNLGTGKLDLEIKSEPPPAAAGQKAPEKQEKEGFTAWGKEAGGLQAGLGYLPGQHRTYNTGEAATLVLRIRNVSKEAVKFQYYRQFFMENPPAVSDGEGKPVRLPSEKDGEEVQVRLPVDVNLAPGKEIELAELNLKLRPASESGNKDFSTSYGTKVSVQYDLYGTGKFTLQYERVFGMTSQGACKLDPTLSKLATGKLDLEIKSEPPPGATEKK